MFIDSHCHVTMSEGGEAALDRARMAGVGSFLVPATSLADASSVIRVAEAHDDVWAALGFHPHEARDFDEAAEDEIRRLARHDRVKAIGEIGLDYHYDRSPRDVQRDVLVRHIEIARDLDLPVIIHNRESTEDMLDILRVESMRGLRGVFHSFTESDEVARAVLDLGFMISFSGILTFNSASELRETARGLPMDRVLIETDTPYLAPVPHRGKPNEPAWVVRVAEALANLWSVPLEIVEKRTSANFGELFRVQVNR